MTKLDKLEDYLISENTEINKGVRFQNLENLGYEFDSVSEDEIEEQRQLAELGMDEYAKKLEEDEHYVDHEHFIDLNLESTNSRDFILANEKMKDAIEEHHFDPVWFKENRLKGEGETEATTFEYNILEQPEFQGSELQKSLNELDREITAKVSKRISEEIDREIMNWANTGTSILDQHLENGNKDFLEGESKLPDYLLNDPEIVGYPDEEMQEEIYEWINSKLPIRHFSIKDLGCGRGDFFRVLMRHNGYSDDRIGIDYFGIDFNPNLIQVGQQKYPEIKLIYNDFIDVSIQTNYTICIGTLNDDHGLDKWEVFNKTLNHALSNTKTAILFVLQADCYGEQGHLDYPIHEIVQQLSQGTKFEIDNSKFEDIYCLTVHIGQF